MRVMSNFGNTTMLTRFLLRRERLSSTLWVLIFAGVVVLLVPALYYAMPPAERFAILDALEMPVMISMIGPAFAAHTDSFGALYTNFMMAFSALTAGVMNIFLIIRLTRADEERGRYEVLRSLPIGRLSALAAALLTAVVANIALAIVTGLGMFGFGAMLGFGSSGICLNGSMLWGATLGATGLIFAAIAALFAQLTASARAATGYSFMALGAFYLLRAAGDMNPDMEILSLISPLGLNLRTQALIENYWWPIWLLLAATAVIAAVSLRLNAARDIDQGIIPSRPGRSYGSSLMKTSGGLNFKILRGSMIAWLVCFVVLAATYGTVLGGLDEFIASNEMYQQLILGPFAIEFLEGLTIDETVAAMRAAVASAGFSVPQLFSAMISLLTGIFVTVPAVLFLLKAKSEEGDGRTELTLAAAVSRRRYLAGFAAIAFIMVVLIQFASALGMYAAAAATLDYIGEFPLSFALASTMIYVPAIWVKLSAAILLIGFAPKVAGVIWAYFAYTFIAMFFGRGFGVFPDWVIYLSPYAFVTQLPLAAGQSVNIVPLIAKVGIAVVLTALGLWFYSKRDINVQ